MGFRRRKRERVGSKDKNMMLFDRVCVDGLLTCLIKPALDISRQYLLSVREPQPTAVPTRCQPACITAYDLCQGTIRM